MKIIYDNVSGEYLYPLSKKDIKKIKQYIDPLTIEKIKFLKFGCNTKTTQEGRIVKRGSIYDIRINFCLKNMQSCLLSDKKQYVEEIKKFGGKLNLSARTIDWKLSDSKRYALYILFHEIGHIHYCLKYLGGKLNTKTSQKEEHWCNSFAQRAINKITNIF